jgi:hypothetical protein
MASRSVRLQFVAMERSLRAVGCDLPLWVIPYDDDLFDLPPNATWWRVPEVLAWVSAERLHPTMRKYQCLTVGEYHFFDADVILLSNPSDIVAPFEGLVSSCTEWNKPRYTYTPESAAFFYSKSSTWQQRVFSTGQFAIDRPLYTAQQLRQTAESAEFIEACIRYPLHEQPGLNQLVYATGILVTNLTLPPHNMESTWAGDYPGQYEHLWKDASRKPYLIHWAGPKALHDERPISSIFRSFLTREERAEWDAQVIERRWRREIESQRKPWLVRAWKRGVRELRMVWPKWSRITIGSRDS